MWTVLRERKPPPMRLTSTETDPGFQSGFLPDRSQNIVDSSFRRHFAKCRENRPVAVSEMLINVLKSPIPQRRGKRNSDPRSYPETDTKTKT